VSRTRTTENFPVGSWLVAARHRPVVHAFYRFARMADDIADDPDLAPEEKIRRLDALDAELTGAPGDGPAAAIRDILAETAVPIDHCRDLLVAFKRDAATPRTRDWDDLMTYCRYSAAPVGRFLLDLHGESRATWPANDALCAALQVLNHLQDCGDDYRALDRVYLPQDSFAAVGAEVGELAAGRSSPGLRRVIDAAIAATRPLVRRARELPVGIRDGGLRRETAVIVVIAERLLEKLAAHDPLAERVELGKLDFAGAALVGLGRSLFGTGA
jgi:farnesyl-diphosphate farnesyltransferase